MLLLSFFFGAAGPVFAAPDELIYADGRRETVENPRKDSKGQWVGTRDGRRTTLKAGEIVAIVDAKGAETVILPELADGPLSAEQTVAAAAVRDPKNKEWAKSIETLAATPARAAHDALLSLAASKDKELRGRAYRGLCGLYTKASALAAADTILNEKDTALRRDSVSILYSVEEILRRCELTPLLERGVADKEALVRIAFALLSPRDHAASTQVLHNDGLKHSDHHVRESCATELARRGDQSGESILISMLGRTKIPEFDGGEELLKKVLTAEQTEVCTLLGAFHTKTARAALEKALKSPFEPVRKAAQAALEKK